MVQAGDDQGKAGYNEVDECDSKFVTGFGERCNLVSQRR